MYLNMYGFMHVRVYAYLYVPISNIPLPSMYVCLCMYVFKYVCFYARTYVCMSVCTNFKYSITIHVRMSMYVCMYLSMYVFMHVRMYACLYVPISNIPLPSMYVCLCMYGSMYECMYLSMYVLCTYVCMHVCIYQFQIFHYYPCTLILSRQENECFSRATNSCEILCENWKICY